MSPRAAEAGDDSLYILDSKRSVPAEATLIFHKRCANVVHLAALP